jgi:prepilin-type N-terminal cleavage/methylation domain-containing protein
MNIKSRSPGGFTLIELLISLAILTAISLSLLSFLSPWMAFKQKLDTDRKLMESKTLFTTVYERNAWTVETTNASVFTFAGGTLTNSPLTGTRSCISQSGTLQSLAAYFSDGLPQGENDGYANPFCFLISPQLSMLKNGVNVYYHNLAIVSTGRDSALDAGTNINATTGALTLGGDDSGVLINGYTIQDKKFRETEARLTRIASLYESYFTARYLQNPSRDVMIDYFASNQNGVTAGWDSAGTISGTGGVMRGVSGWLGALGIGPEEGYSSYETNNGIAVGNFNECVSQATGTTCVRSSNGGTAPPYTALLVAPLPGPADTFLVKVVAGNY